MSGRDRLVQVRIATSLAAALVVGLLAVACGDSEGNECSSDSDCDDSLSCQEILGRGCTTYCCPTPPDTSGADNCQTKEVSGTVATYPTSCPTSGSTTDASQ